MQTTIARFVPSSDANLETFNDVTSSEGIPVTTGEAGRAALAADDPAAPIREGDREHDRLTVSQGLAALSLIVPLLVFGMLRVHRAYRIVGDVLGLGRKPEPVVEQQALVVVPVGAVSRLTQEAMSAALSLGDGVIAVTVRYSDEDDAAECERLQAAWRAWQPDVPLEVLTTHKRSLTRPMVDYLNRLAATAPASPGGFERVMVLIPEVEPRRAWHRLLHNQRGAVLDRAIRRHTEAIVCRMRFHIKGW